MKLTQQHKNIYKHPKANCTVSWRKRINRHILEVRHSAGCSAAERQKKYPRGTFILLDISIKLYIIIRYINFIFKFIDNLFF